MSDYSCYVILTNKTTETLTLSSSNTFQGSFEELPQSVAPGGGVAITLKESQSIGEGSAGSCSYQTGTDPLLLSMVFKDPTAGPNEASGEITGNNPNNYSFTFTGAAGSPNDPGLGSVPSFGHPIYVNYTLSEG